MFRNAAKLTLSAFRIRPYLGLGAAAARDVVAQLPPGSSDMAATSEPGRSEHDAELDAVASDALRGVLATPFTSDSEYARRIRRILGPLCSTARRRGQRAEEVVIRLKGLWPSIGASADNPYGRRDAIFERVVSLCIEEYYRTPDSPLA